jgi:hypothetical protein
VTCDMQYRYHRWNVIFKTASDKERAEPNIPKSVVLVFTPMQPTTKDIDTSEVIGVESWPRLDTESGIHYVSASFEV